MPEYTNVDGIQLRPKIRRGHRSDTHLWWEQHGTVMVNGEKWYGHLFLFVGPEDAEEQRGDDYRFLINRDTYYANSDWNYLSVEFASPYGNLSIDSIEVESCEPCA